MEPPRDYSGHMESFSPLGWPWLPVLHWVLHWGEAWYTPTITAGKWALVPAP